MMQIELFCSHLYRQTEVNVAMVHDLTKSQTTYLVTAPPGKLKLSRIESKMKQCFDCLANMESGAAQQIDPFWVHRVILAMVITDLDDSVQRLLWDFDDDKGVMNKANVRDPEILKQKTKQVHESARKLDELTRDIGSVQMQLRVIAQGSFRLFENMTNTPPISLSVSVKDELDFLANTLAAMKIDLDHMLARKETSTNLVRKVNSNCTQRLTSDRYTTLSARNRTRRTRS